MNVNYILPPQSFSSDLSPTPQSILPSHLKVLGMHFPLSQVNSCSAQVYALKNNNINTIYESFNKVKFLQIKKNLLKYCFVIHVSKLIIKTSKFISDQKMLLYIEYKGVYGAKYIVNGFLTAVQFVFSVDTISHSIAENVAIYTVSLVQVGALELAYLTFVLYKI